MIETFYTLSCPLMFAFLSDTHETDPEPILESLKKQRPEIILITGDFVRGEWAENAYSKMEESPNAMRLLRECAQIAPVFVSMGNHERTITFADRDIIAGTGAIILDNSFIRYGNTLIGGLSSVYYTEYEWLRTEHAPAVSLPKYPLFFRRTHPEPDLSWLENFEKQDGYKILLCHHPEYFPRYLKNRKIDLILSGHCHGGQWRYYSLIHKEWRGVFSPGQGLFPALTSGIYDGRLLVSRGLSNTTMVPRINNPEEVIYCVPRSK